MNTDKNIPEILIRVHPCYPWLKVHLSLGDNRNMSRGTRPSTLQELRASGWVSKTVKHEIRDNFLRMLQAGEELFPGIIGYENTVIPEINLALLAGHDMLFLGEKGQAKSRLMRSLVRFLDEEIPYLDHPVLSGPRRPVSPDHVGRQASAGRTARVAGADRLVAAAAALRRAAVAGHQVRRHHRRDRSGQAGRPAPACPPRRRCTSASFRACTAASSP